MERVHLDGTIFPSGAMAVGGVVSRSVDTFRCKCKCTTHLLSAP